MSGHAELNSDGNKALLSEKKVQQAAAAVRMHNESIYERLY